MAKIGWLGAVWLTRFSRPAGERVLHRHVRRRPPRRILEVGLGTLRRTERLLSLIPVTGGDPVQYVGLDRFEGRLASDPPGVTLKQAHQKLHSLGRVQLVPGNPDTSLARLCNHLGIFDLVLVSADSDPRHLERCWFFIQRLTNGQTKVFAETAVGAAEPATLWKVIDRPRIDELAARTLHRRAA